MIELKKYSYRQTKDGCIISFVMHPNDDNRALAEADIGAVFEAEFRESITADRISEEELLKGLADLQPTEQ